VSKLQKEYAHRASFNHKSINSLESFAEWGQRNRARCSRFDSGARGFLWVFARGYSQEFFHGWVRFVQKILQAVFASRIVFCVG
jgi:hypothetical protein